MPLGAPRRGSSPHGASELGEQERHTRLECGGRRSSDTLAPQRARPAPPPSRAELLTADNSGSVKWWDDCEAGRLDIVTWPASNPEAEKRINCVDLSPPAAAELGGKQFLLVSTAAGHVQVWETEETRLVSWATRTRTR